MRNGNFLKRFAGFTLVELLVVLSILALLLTIASPRYFESVERAKEASLRQSLVTVREAIDQYYADMGQYPEDIESLVQEKYINKMPKDPMTERMDTWLIDEPEPPLEGGVYDIHSGAEGVAQDGTKYSEW